MSLNALYYGFMILIVVVMICFQIVKLCKSIVHSTATVPTIASTGFSLLFYVLTGLFFFQLSLGTQWVGEYILPIRNFSLFEDGNIPTHAPIFFGLTTLVMVSQSFYRGIFDLFQLLVLRKRSQETFQSLQFIIVTALTIGVISTTVLRTDLTGVTKQLLETFSQQFVESEKETVKREYGYSLTGVITDKYNCISCTQTDESFLWNGRYQISYPSTNETLYLIRVENTVFNVDKSTWDNLSIGNQIKVTYTSDTVLNITTITTN